jgi:hypothetical protein
MMAQIMTATGAVHEFRKVPTGRAFRPALSRRAEVRAFSSGLSVIVPTFLAQVDSQHLNWMPDLPILACDALEVLKV